MTISELIAKARSRDIRLWVDQGKLHFNGPAGAMDEGLRQEIADNKEAFIELLSRDHEAPLIEIVDRGSTQGLLSFAQQRLLFMSDAFGASTTYNMPSVYELLGDLDVERLKSSLAASLRRHEALRSSFRNVDGTYVADVSDELSLPFAMHDCSLEEDAVEAARAATDDALAHVFDLADAPLARFTLIKIDEARHRFVINLHHAVSDGWSHGILLREIWEDYSAEDETAAGATGKYSDYVAWQNAWLSSAEYQKQRRFWDDCLTGANDLIDLPTDRPRPTQPDYTGSVVTFELPHATTLAVEAFNRELGVTEFVSLVSALFFLLNKYSGQSDICIGTPVANRRKQSWEDTVGFFSNVVVLRSNLEEQSDLRELTTQISASVLAALEHQDFPFERVVEQLQPERSLSHSPLFQVMFVYEQESKVHSPPGLEVRSTVEDLGSSKFDLTVTIKREGDRLKGGVEYSTALFDRATIERFAEHFRNVIDAMTGDEPLSLAALSPLSNSERQSLLTEFAGPECLVNPPRTVHERILATAAEFPERIALRDEGAALSYAELARRVDAFASRLVDAGVAKGDRVGVSLDRDVSAVVAMLATMRAGAAYVPVDPGFPALRKRLICDDADLKLVITVAEFEKDAHSLGVEVLLLDEIWPDLDRESDAVFPTTDTKDLAYVIYTSGSTGKPKGVMVSHANVTNLFAGLNEALADSMDDVDGIPTFRALTSISFDISVLELLWTLAEGFQVIVERDHFSALAKQLAATASRVPVTEKAKALDFGLFYFASYSDRLDDQYQLLKEGAKYADANGFSAVWVPERHFHSFGGQFPNPSVAAAYLSGITENVEIRAGSVVLPLHHPIRVAEDWSMIDNLSNGRAAVAFASGWHFNDFVLAPKNYEDRHQVMRDSIDTVRRLWSGAPVEFVDGKGNASAIRIYPEPKREQLPVWITSAANPETFRMAGAIDANVLTHFLGQSLTDLEEKIAIYRAAREENGFDPDAGRVTIMLHTYLADDYETALEVVEEPFKAYLRSSFNLLLPVAQSAGLDAEHDHEAVVEAGFQKYSRSNSALFGTPETAVPLMNDLAEIGVNEIACLVDFGVEKTAVVEGFSRIGRLASVLKGTAESDELEIGEVAASHIQCTPSYAQLLLDSGAMDSSLQSVSAFLVGGEPLTPGLAKRLRRSIPGSLFNMYGPTETTVWSTAGKIDDGEITLGLPIANTELYVLDANLEPVPFGVKGELFIAGDGVTQGYWRRPDLTAESFIPHPFSAEPGARLYRTGDLVKRRDDGSLVFLGRRDNQVKVRGYRIELDEVRRALERLPGVSKAAAIVHRGERKDAAILGYVSPDSDGDGDLQVPELLQTLKLELPEYMVPSALFVLHEFPYTPNGKLDTKSLPTQLVKPVQKLVPAANDTEAKVLEIWKELLRVDEIGTQDSFFELGGHSLLLAKLQQRIESRFDVSLKITDLFKFPTVSSLAARISTHDARGNPTTRSADRQSRRESVRQMRNQMRRRNRRA